MTHNDNDNDNDEDDDDDDNKNNSKTIQWMKLRKCDLIEDK